MPRHYGAAHEKKIKKQRESERQVLQHLKKIDRPKNWESLHIFFDLQRTGAIAPVLQGLKQSGYIAVDTEDNVTLTDAGLRRLADGEF